MSVVDHASLYDAAGADLRRMVRREAYRRRDLAAERLADVQTPEAREDYRRAEQRRIDAIEGGGR